MQWHFPPPILPTHPPTHPPGCRVESLDFNISAPHMHATCLEALQLEPGHRVIDVGSGCGVLTACMAHIVGKRGAAVGIDIRKHCVQLCKDNVRQLAAQSIE
jgi:protein-L-isoaspartate O-methyltransferase